MPDTDGTVKTDGTGAAGSAGPSVPAVPSVLPDGIGIALGAVGAGASFGGAVVAAGLLIFRTWQASGAAIPPRLPLLSGPLLTGIALSVTLTWRLTRLIPDVWQRGITAGLALFGSAMLAALAAPADTLGGRPGIALYGLALILSGWTALRRVRRSSAA
ncbi:MAG TPA: hypothetical protein VGI83_01695 [Gemmatimonadales bacterium]|jgi:hypothetical protein